jgi:hypothetical protein
MIKIKIKKKINLKNKLKNFQVPENRNI